MMTPSAWLPKVLTFLAGAGVALALGGLFLRSGRGAAGGSRPVPTSVVLQKAAEVASAHGGGEELPPEVAGEIARLRLQAQAAPGDLAPRKQLALALLANGRLVEAFEAAGEVLRASADDPDGLYVQGEVRLAMGQWQKAIELLDRVLARHPDHRLARAAREKAQAGLGHAGLGPPSSVPMPAPAPARGGSRLLPLPAPATGLPG